MELIQWDNTLATGIDWQDEQHRGLLDHLHELHYALLSGGAAEQLPQSLRFLEEWT